MIISVNSFDRSTLDISRVPGFQCAGTAGTGLYGLEFAGVGSRDVHVVADLLHQFRPGSRKFEDAIRPSACCCPLSYMPVITPSEPTLNDFGLPEDIRRHSAVLPSLCLLHQKSALKNPNTTSELACAGLVRRAATGLRTSVADCPELIIPSSSKTSCVSSGSVAVMSPSVTISTAMSK